MQMRFLVLSALFFCIPMYAGAQVQYKSGDSLYCWASSLNMRDSPGPKAKILGHLPYGAVVEIADSSIGQTAMEFKALEGGLLEDGHRYKPFFLKGYWVKINYRGTDAYVFDGYLNQLKPPKTGEDKFGNLESWALNTLKLKPKKEKSKSGEGAWTTYMGKQDQIRISIGYTEKTAFREIRLKNISFNEVSMLGLQIFEGVYLMESKADKLIFKSKDNNGDCEIRITRDGEWMVINLSCNC